MKFLSGQLSRLLDYLRNYNLIDSVPISKKRECESHHWYEDSDEEIEIEPPPKRSRLLNYGNEDFIKRFGSISGKRILGSLFSLPTSSQSLDSIVNKENSVKQQKYIAAGTGIGLIKDSYMGNEENFNNSMVDSDLRETEEIKYLGSTVKIPNSNPCNIDSTFKFSPTVIPSKFSPRITSTLNRQANADSKWKQPYTSKNSKELLDLKRTPLKAKRPSLLGKYVNSTKFCFSNLKTTMQSVRLSEKKEYRKLLEQYKLPNQHYNRPISSFKNSSNKSALSIIHLGPKYALEKKKSFHEKEKNGNKFPIVVSLDVESSRHSAYEIPVIDLVADEVTLGNSKDDEIFITKHIKPPKRQSINSLEEKLLKCEYYRGEDIQNNKAEEQEKSKIFQDAIKKIEETSLKRSQIINDLHNVENLSSSLSKLTTRYPVGYIEITDEEEGKLPELTKEIKAIIHHAFKGGSPSQVLAEKFNIQITRKDICTLAGLNWLNDEIINFYMNMIVARSQKDKCHPNVYAFNTFFYSKLVNNGYGPVRRWTKKIDIFTYDLLLIPVHLGMHWCLATIDFRSKSIRYYDSMLGDNYKCLEALKNYLCSEHLDKRKAPYEVALSVENMKEIPQQMNGSDCGMFACKFAEYLSRNASITFTQENMPYFRNRMVYEIVAQKLIAEPLRPYT